MYDLSRHPQWKRIQSICQKFHSSGFEIYLVGGCVRDALLGRPPKDFDFSTNAKPEETEALFEKTNPIGKAFGTIQVVLEEETYEITTFRKDLDYKDGRHPEAIAFTNAEEDAKRRDFKMNGLFLEPLSGKIFDYVGGEEDIEAERISFIGDAETRIREDKLRMLRAIRFSAQLDFTVEASAKQAIRKYASEISQVSRERIHVEITKMFSSENFRKGLSLIEELDFFCFLYPDLTSQEKKQIELHQFFDKMAKDTPCVDFWIEHMTEKGTYLHCFYLFWFLTDLGWDERKIETVLRQYKFSKVEILRIQNWLKWKQEFAKEISLSHLKKQIPKEGFSFFYAVAPILFSPKPTKLLQILQKILQGKSADLYVLPTNYVTSQDLSQRGVEPGKRMGDLLQEAFDMQLEEKITSRDEALQYIEKQIGS